MIKKLVLLLDYFMVSALFIGEYSVGQVVLRQNGKTAFCLADLAQE
jgi:hypothetical protein